MCIALPAQVVAVDGAGATIESEMRRQQASTQMFPDIQAGEWVFVAAGMIVSRLTPEEAEQIRDALRATMRRKDITKTGGSRAVS